VGRRCWLAWGGCLAVAPAAAARGVRATGTRRTRHESAEAQGAGKLKGRGLPGQAYVRSGRDKNGGSEEDRSAARLAQADGGPRRLGEATGGGPSWRSRPRMQSDRALGRVLSFFHEIQGVRPGAGGRSPRSYLDAGVRT